MKELNVPQHLIDEANQVVLATRPIFDPARYGVKAEESAGPQAAAAPSLYQRIGGAAAVQATVEVFYKKVLAGTWSLQYENVGCWWLDAWICAGCLQLCTIPDLGSCR